MARRTVLRPALEGVPVAVRHRDADLRPSDGAADRTAHLVEVLLQQPVQGPLSGEAVQGDVRLGGVLAPRAAAADLRVAAVEVHDELAAVVFEILVEQMARDEIAGAVGMPNRAVFACHDYILILFRVLLAPLKITSFQFGSL